jgi:hypothetical protein
MLPMESICPPNNTYIWIFHKFIGLKNEFSCIKKRHWPKWRRSIILDSVYIYAYQLFHKNMRSCCSFRQVTWDILVVYRSVAYLWKEVYLMKIQVLVLDRHKNVAMVKPWMNFYYKLVYTCSRKSVWVNAHMFKNPIYLVEIGMYLSACPLK